MSAAAGPDIITNGLVFHVDPSDPKCYSGGSICRDLTRINGNGTLNDITFSSDKAFQMNGSESSVINFTRSYTNVANQHTFVAMVFCPNIVNLYGSAYFLQSLNPSFGGLTMGFYTLFDAGSTGFQLFGGTDDGSSYNDGVSSGPTSELLNRIIICHGVMSGNTTKIYINQFLRSTTTHVGSGSINIQNVIKLGFDDIAFLPTEAGLKIYKAMIYNRALADSEVLQNYNAMKGRARLS